MTTNDNRAIEVPTCVVPIELMEMISNRLYEAIVGINNPSALSDYSFLLKQIDGILIHYNLNGDRVDE